MIRRRLGRIGARVYVPAVRYNLDIVEALVSPCNGARPPRRPARAAADARAFFYRLEVENVLQLPARGTSRPLLDRFADPWGPSPPPAHGEPAALAPKYPRVDGGFSAVGGVPARSCPRVVLRCRLSERPGVLPAHAGMARSGSRVSAVMPRCSPRMRGSSRARPWIETRCCRFASARRGAARTSSMRRCGPWEPMKPRTRSSTTSR